MTELFDIPDSPSPKLKWLCQHGLVTSHHPEYAGECPENGEEVFPWTCSRHSPTKDHTISQGIIGVGRTEEEAIVDYCQRTGITHYSLS